MELFAIVLSVPVAFVASAIYGLFVAKVVRKHQRLGRWAWWASVAVLGAIAIELILLASFGAVRSRRMLGAGLYPTHLALFFLGAPALANLLLLRSAATFRRICVAAFLCTLLALGLVLLQYGVSEALYGADGTTGPFSGV